MRQTILTKSIKLALFKPRARLELIAFYAHDQLEWEREWGLSAEENWQTSAR